MSIVLNSSSFEGPALSFMLPYNTVRGVSTELVDVREGLDRMRVQMVSALLSTIFIGMHTACAAYAAKVQIDRGLTGKSSRSRRALLCVTVAMYAATLASWVALVVSQFRSLTTIKNGLIETSSWIPPEDCFVQRPVENLPGYCTTLPAARPSVSSARDSSQECVGTGALTFNVVLGDAIVWWRVWVLWNKNRFVLIACCVVLLATLVFGALDTAVSCASGLLDDPLGKVSNRVAAGGAFFEGNFFGLCAIGVSLASNSGATLLVGCKAWKHRLRATKYFADVQSVSRAQRVMMLLVESGVAYCLLWALVLSSNASWIISSPGLSAWSNIMLYFTEGCIVALVGIYPTLIIVLVALDKSEIAKHTLAWSAPSVPFSSEYRVTAQHPDFDSDSDSGEERHIELRPPSTRSSRDAVSVTVSAISSRTSADAMVMVMVAASPAPGPGPEPIGRTSPADSEGWT